MRNLTLFGFYALSFANANSTGSTFVPTNPYNSAVDYGRASFAVRNHAVIGGSYTARYHITLSPFLIANSGTPYNITTGLDNNGDSVFNDRPTFNGSPNAVTASCFNANPFSIPASVSGQYPSPGQTVPINYCTGPSNITFNLRASKTIGFGLTTLCWMIWGMFLGAPEA